MKISTSKWVSLAIGLASLSLPIASNATQGYFTLGTGSIDDGLAGAGVALPQDSSIGAVNPAGIVRVGNQYQIGVALFQPSRQYSVNGAPSGAEGTFGLTPGTVKSNDTSFGIPNLGYTHTLTSKTALAFNIYANGGLDTDYPGSAGGGAGTFYGGPAGVSLEQLFIVPSYSVSLNKSWALGFSLVGAYQIFSASGLKNFGDFVSDGNPNDLTNNGNDTSFSVGEKIGLLYNASSSLALGAVYQTQTGGAHFDKYSDLFAGRGSFNVPATFDGGLALKTSKSSVLAADVQYIWYSDVAAVSDPLTNLTSAEQSGNKSELLGGSNGAGFGWRNTTYFKVGYQQTVSKSWDLRGGIAYGRQPILSQNVLFNILAPGVTEWHYSLGATDRVSRNHELSVAFTYAPNITVSGPNVFEVPGQQTINLSMHQFEVEGTYSVKY